MIYLNPNSNCRIQILCLQAQFIKAPKMFHLYFTYDSLPIQSFLYRPKLYANENTLLTKYEFYEVLSHP